jgi:hypothetical protein
VVTMLGVAVGVSASARRATLCPAAVWGAWLAADARGAAMNGAMLVRPQQEQSSTALTSASSTATTEPRLFEPAPQYAWNLRRDDSRIVHRPTSTRA